MKAMPRASGALRLPKSWPAAATVATVSAIRQRKMTRYTRQETGCGSDISVTSQQVEEGEEEDPHDVDEVPVEPSEFDGRVPAGRVASAAGVPGQERQDGQPGDHVQGV